MISAGRILAVFRKNGEDGEFTKIADQLSADQRSAIQGRLKCEAPLIASVRSSDDWFALTSSYLYRQKPGAMHKIRLDSVENVDRQVFMAGGKFHGGLLELRLKDKSSFAITVESGRPYTGLLNVFLYVERVNRKSGRSLSGRRLMTNDERPTTVL
jgi:hypothetical protein